MSLAVSRQLADNCHWADNQPSLLVNEQTFPIITIEWTNIPHYCHGVDEYIHNYQLGGKNVML